MTNRTIITLFLLLFTFPYSFAQAGSYKVTHFQKNTGFPGDKIYAFLEDSRGYIWIGTERGLVCYNGYSFKTYTTKDGLPDNEIFDIAEDSKGKIWLTPFAKEVCYIRQGKVYSKQNDPVLKQLQLTSVPRMQLDKQDNMWLIGEGTLTRISADGKVSGMTAINGKPLLYDILLSFDTTGRLLVLNEGRLYRYVGGKFDLVLQLPPHPNWHDQTWMPFIAIKEFLWVPLPVFLEHYKAGKHVYYHKGEYRYVNDFALMPGNKIGVATTNGLYLKDIKTGKIAEHLLKNQNISRWLTTKDSSLWVGTLGNGVFHFFSSPIKSVPLDKDAAKISFMKAGSESVICTSEDGILIQVKFKATKQPEVVSKSLLDKMFPYQYCTYASQNPDGSWIVSQRGCLMKYARLGTAPADSLEISSSKCTAEENGNRLLIGTPRGVFRVDKESFRILDTLLRERATAITKVKSTIYTGTLDGLFIGEPGKKMRPYLPEEPLLRRHITAVCADTDSTLWVANNEAVVIAIRHNKVIARFDKSTGIECGSINVLKTSDSLLWLGTDNGLYAVQKKQPFRVIKHLTDLQGLNSATINCLDVGGGYIWVGTDKGLNYFEEGAIRPDSSRSSFFITAVRNDGTDVLDQPVIRLKGKTLGIDFDAIDHSGISKPQFSYQLDNSPWINLDNQGLYFPATPYGHFTISLKATSPNWAAPKILNLSFYKPYPVYLRWWFLLLTGLILVSVLGIAIRFFFRRIRQKEKGQLLIQQNLLQLEQLALQGQMNSHFIFNCLSAIRQYYNKGELSRANHFLDIFSQLIRMTFEMVNQTFTTLEHELVYLKQYLMVEQERFGYSFIFSIRVDANIDVSVVPVPTLMLQPFIENAVKHGVQHLPHGAGKIDIALTQQQEFINIVIEDNGPGRSKRQAALQRPGLTITSTSVNARRIDVLNKLFDDSIRMSIEDIQDGERISGTRVILSYPISIYDYQ